MELIPLLAQASKFLEVTLGNVITLAVTLIAIVVSWQKQKDQIEHLEIRMAKAEEVFEELTKHGLPSICVTQSHRLTKLEQEMAGVHAMIERVSVNVEWIKDHLKQQHQERRTRA